CARLVQPPDERRVRAQLASDPGQEPVRVVGAAVRRAEHDATIDAARAPEQLEPGARDQPAQAVADEIDAPPADAAAQSIAQLDCRVLDPMRPRIAEPQERAGSEHTEKAGEGGERRAAWERDGEGERAVRRASAARPR